MEDAMLRTVTDIRAAARLAFMNREAALVAVGLVVALSIGGWLAEAALDSAVAPMIR